MPLQNSTIVAGPSTSRGALLPLPNWCKPNIVSSVMNQFKAMTAAAGLVGAKQERAHVNVLNLKKFLEDYHGICIVCLVSTGIMCSHALAKCPNMIREAFCLQCLSNEHLYSHCCNRLLFPLTARVCWVCGLPGEFGETRFHEFNQMGRSCKSKAKDLVIVLCWLLRRMHHPLCKKTANMSDKEYAEWLTECREEVIY